MRALVALAAALGLGYVAVKAAPWVGLAILGFVIMEGAAR